MTQRCGAGGWKNTPWGWNNNGQGARSKEQVVAQRRSRPVRAAGGAVMRQIVLVINME